MSKKDEDEDELVIIETLPEDEESNEDMSDDADKESANQDDNDNDDDDDDEDDDKPDKVKEHTEEEKLRRRESYQERKRRRAEAIKRDKAELEYLRQQNENLERRIAAQEKRAHEFDVNSYEAQIQHAKQQAEQAERIISKAIAAGEGQDVTEAIKYREQALLRAQELQQRKQLIAQQQQQRPQAPVMNPLVQRYAQDFIKENSWYDPSGRDEDSAIVLTIDSALAKDGYDPATSEYWAELRKRVARRIPERFSPPKPREPRGGPAVGNGREYTPPSTRKEVYISPERKQALIEAGVWDDPVQRKEYVKYYMEHDKKSKR